jgi:cardiolipin synthase C
MSTVAAVVMARATPGNLGARRATAAACLALVALLSGCAAAPGRSGAESPEAVAAMLQRARETSIFGPTADFTASAFPEVGTTELYPVRAPQDCEIAVPRFGEDSFAVRLETLKQARQSIRIQALVFKGDETGLRIAEVLKQKRAEGLDVRVIVDAFSNPWLQTQWMLFDLKQHGIEVEGYEALFLQWINEVPIPKAMPHFDPRRPDKRFHEKLWIVDGGTAQAIAVTGGLNVGNEYFRADPDDPAGYWRDQDVVVRGAVVDDLVAAFDHTFDYLVRVKKSRGILNTNLYWGATRGVLDRTGRFPVPYRTHARLVERVARMEAARPALQYLGSTCRFLHSRPRMQEGYILEAYLKLIAAAREELLIANAYFVPTPPIRAALREAAARCVAITLVTNSPDTNDLPEISLVGRGLYQELLAYNRQPEVARCTRPGAGIRLFEWLGRTADGSGPRYGTMHSKFAVVDRRLALVGSYNLDPRSARLNSETALAFENPVLAAQLAASILDHDLRFSDEVSPEEAAGFGSPQDAVVRFRHRLGKLFEAEL